MDPLKAKHMVQVRLCVWTMYMYMYVCITRTCTLFHCSVSNNYIVYFRVCLHMKWPSISLILSLVLNGKASDDKFT